MTASTGVTHQTAISADGTPIAYWQSGHGPPLVLVHGGTSDHSRWATLLDRLDPHVTSYAMDRRGRGQSGDGRSYSLDWEAEDVAAVVEAVAAHAGVGVDVFGHSLGGLCSLEAARLTSKVRKLVLYEAPTHPHDADISADFVGRFEALVAEGRREEAVEVFFREVVRMPEGEIEIVRTHPAWPQRVANVHTLAREGRALKDYRFEPGRFAAISVPTLLLVGGDSSPAVRASTDAVANALPSARIAVLEGEQHMALDTAPDLLIATTLTFLDRAAPG